MRESRRRPRLTDETSTADRLGHRRRNNLDSDSAIEPTITTGIHHRHPAPAQQPLQQVTPRKQARAAVHPNHANDKVPAPCARQSAPPAQLRRTDSEGTRPAPTHRYPRLHRDHGNELARSEDWPYPNWALQRCIKWVAGAIRSTAATPRPLYPANQLSRTATDHNVESRYGICTRARRSDVSA